MSRVNQILRDAQPSTKRFLPALLSGFATAASAVALLGTSAWLITRAAEQPPELFIAVAVVGVRAFAISRGVFRYLERLTSHDAALQQLAQVRSDLVRRLGPLAPDGLSRTHTGQLLSNLVDDVNELQNLPLRVVLPLVTAGVTSAAAVIFVAFLNPLAAGVLAICLLAAFALAVGLGALVGARTERALSPLREHLSNALVDEFAGLDVLTAYGAEHAASERVRQADTALRKGTTRRALAQGLTLGSVSFLAAIASVWVLCATLGSRGIGGFDGPALTVVVLIPMAIFDVFGPVPLALASWRQVRSAAQRIARTVPEQIPPEVPSDTTSPQHDLPALGSGIVLENVTARWPQSSDGLHGIDLALRPGERVLVSGPSGAGKTTLAHVLVRFLNYTGSYRINGTEVSDCDGDAVRKLVGLVEQNPYLFDESIRQNLLFAHDSASDQQLWDVLHRVGLADWARHRGGLDVAVGERGALVSGGQAQRIALARAILADFPVLILDEPTAGVDTAQADSLVREMLGAVATDHAVLVISHVPLPENLIDRHVHLDAGRIISAAH